MVCEIKTGCLLYLSIYLARIYRCVVLVVVVGVENCGIAWLDGVCETLVFGRGTWRGAVVALWKNRGTFGDGVLNGSVSVPCEVQVFAVGRGWHKTTAYVIALI